MRASSPVSSADLGDTVSLVDNEPLEMALLSSDDWSF